MRRSTRFTKDTRLVDEKLKKKPRVQKAMLAQLLGEKNAVQKGGILAVCHDENCHTWDGTGPTSISIVQHTYVGQAKKNPSLLPFLIPLSLFLRLSLWALRTISWCFACQCFSLCIHASCLPTHIHIRLNPNVFTRALASAATLPSFPSHAHSMCFRSQQLAGTT